MCRCRHDCYNIIIGLSFFVTISSSFKVNINIKVLIRLYKHDKEHGIWNMLLTLLLGDMDIVL